MKRIISIFMLFLIIAGCGTTQIKPEQKASLRTIAVVSIIGNELRFRKIGATIFNNDVYNRDTSDWKLDAEIEKIATEELKKSSPDIKIASIPFDKVELNKIYKLEGFGDYTSIDRILPELSSKLAQNPVDAVLLIHREATQDPILNTNAYLEGYGVYYRSLPLVDSYMKPYVIFNIVLLEGKTFKPISEKLKAGVSTEFGKTKISWEDQLKNNLNNDMLKNFHSAIIVLIKSNLETGLKEMGF